MLVPCRLVRTRAAQHLRCVRRATLGCRVQRRVATQGVCVVEQQGALVCRQKEGKHVRLVFTGRPVQRRRALVVARFHGSRRGSDNRSRRLEQAVLCRVVQRRLTLTVGGKDVGTLARCKVGTRLVLPRVGCPAEGGQPVKVGEPFVPCGNVEQLGRPVLQHCVNERNGTNGSCSVQGILAVGGDDVDWCASVQQRHCTVFLACLYRQVQRGLFLCIHSRHVGSLFQ
mmetsp:Transcript_3799/g.12284  ORF Transcript_3799/g.12284 Transcript_3799/m.12284 type:complete len:227 (+) Transcript_3799:689-1369(+)